MLRSQSKPKTAYDLLLKMAQELGPEARLPSLRELSATHGFSMKVLNVALRELQREKILYARVGAGIFVASQRRFLVLCSPEYFTGTDDSIFWDVLLLETQKYVRDQNLNCEFYFINPPGLHGDRLPEHIGSAILEGNIQGVLALGMSYSLVQWVHGRGVPIATIPGFGPWSFEFNYDVVIERSVQQLGRFACRDIAFWAPEFWRVRDDEATSTRLPRRSPEAVRWFRGLLSETGVNDKSVLETERDLIPVQLETDFKISRREMGYRLAMDVFGSNRWPWPDGIVIHIDVMTRGVLDAFEELGVRLGQDVLVATHANRNSPLLAPYEDDLILVECDIPTVVHDMFHLLQRLANGENVKEHKSEIMPSVRIGRNLEKRLAPKTKRI